MSFGQSAWRPRSLRVVSFLENGRYYRPETSGRDFSNSLFKEGKSVISHVFIAINDFDRAFEFYSSLMNELGLILKFNDPAKPWAAWHAAGSPRPLFIIGRPFDSEPAVAGNGHMVALLASSAEMVNRSHSVALSKGAQCEGAPGLRPQYHAHYYGAYFRDLDGNKICICFHG